MNFSGRANVCILAQVTNAIEAYSISSFKIKACTFCDCLCTATVLYSLVWSVQFKELVLQLPVTLSYLPRCCSAYKYHYQAMNISGYKFHSQYSEYHLFLTFLPLAILFTSIFVVSFFRKKCHS